MAESSRDTRPLLRTDLVVNGHCYWYRACSTVIYDAESIMCCTPPVGSIQLVPDDTTEARPNKLAFEDAESITKDCRRVLE
jgi:hypothetical protein